MQIRYTLLFLLMLFSGPLLFALFGTIKLGQDWRTAPRDSTGLAPSPTTTQEAVIQVYSARAFDWRGIFAVHTWVATKAENVNHYKVHQVIGWRLMRDFPVVVSAPDIPDRSWFGNDPEILLDIRGAKATVLIPKIEQAVASYPYPETYHVWPGPNSNTFVAWIARQVPELRLELPSTALGKDYLGNAVLAPAPSGTGYQLSLFGLAGILLARHEGLEVNILGLNFGIDPLSLAIKLPAVGNVGWSKRE